MVRVQGSKFCQGVAIICIIPCLHPILEFRYIHKTILLTGISIYANKVAEAI